MLESFFKQFSDIVDVPVDQVSSTSYPRELLWAYPDQYASMLIMIVLYVPADTLCPPVGIVLSTGLGITAWPAPLTHFSRH